MNLLGDVSDLKIEVIDMIDTSGSSLKHNQRIHAAVENDKKNAK